MRTIKVDFPDIGEGEIAIPGLGVFTNGEHEVSDEQEATFAALGKEFPEGDVFTVPQVEEEPQVEEPEPEQTDDGGDEE
jgi:hypothetical protein